MSDSKGSALRQMDQAETDKMAGKCVLDHLVRLVPAGLGTPQFSCSCGMSFPVSEGQVANHLRWVLELRAEEIGAVPHPSWGGFAKPEADAPEPLAAGTRLKRLLDGNAAQLEQSETLIRDLSALLKAPGYSVKVGEETLARADAFLHQGDEAFREVERITETFNTGKSRGTVTYDAGGRFDDRDSRTVEAELARRGVEIDDSPETEAVRQAAVAAADDMDRELTDDDWNTIQELLNAIGAMPIVAIRVDAFLRGRGFDDPPADIAALREKAF